MSVTMIKTGNLLKRLFENPRNIVLVTDEHYNIRYASSTVETIFGIDPVSILGKNGFDFVPETRRQEWRDCLTEANGNGTGEIKLRTNNL
jgi:PAS domain S-box-containing protein